mgnify:CR=1 FL=1
MCVRPFVRASSAAVLDGKTQILKGFSPVLGTNLTVFGSELDLLKFAVLDRKNTDSKGVWLKKSSVLGTNLTIFGSRASFGQAKHRFQRDLPQKLLRFGTNLTIFGSPSRIFRI